MEGIWRLLEPLERLFRPGPPRFRDRETRPRFAPLPTAGRQPLTAGALHVGGQSEDDGDGQRPAAGKPDLNGGTPDRRHRIHAPVGSPTAFTPVRLHSW